MKTRQTRHFVRRYLLFLVPLALVLGALVYTLYLQELSHHRDTLLEAQRRHLQLSRDELGDEFRRVAADLQFLAQLNATRAWAAGPSRENRALLAAEFEGFMRRKGGYDRIALMGGSGREVVGVDAEAAGKRSAAHDANVSERAWLTATLALDSGGIYVQPPVPETVRADSVIRFATPVYAAGATRGVLVLELATERMAKTLWRHFHFFHGRIHLLDADGVQLGGVDVRTDGNRHVRWPDELARAVRDRIFDCDFGHFDVGGGLLSYITVRPLEHMHRGGGIAVSGPDEGAWKLVSYIPPGELRAGSADFLDKVTTLYGVMLVMLGVGAFFLVRTWERLRHERDYTRQVVEMSPAVICGLDAEGRTLFVNNAAEQVTGYKASELIGRNWWETLFPGEQQRQAVGLFRALADGPVRDHETELVTRDGEKRCIAWNAIVRYDDQGNPKELVGFGNDVTERRRIDSMRREFVAMVGHELRTPLTSIRGALGLLTAGAADPGDAKGRELLRIADKNSRHLAHVIDDILDMQRLEAGRMSFDLQSESLQALLRHAVEANRTYADQVGVALRFHPPESDVEVCVDKSRFGQVMNNLLSNAAKFAPPGGTVDVRVEPLGDYVRVGVSDCGPGIAERHREDVFAPFMQVDGSASRHRGGTGLGLYITRKLVEAMNGRIDFESAPGFGTVFHLDLPIDSCGGRKDRARSAADR